MGQVLKVEDLKRRNGKQARPNVYKRSLEARDSTNAYLAEMERKAAGIEEPVPVQMKIKVWQIAAATLAAVGIVVGAFIL